jgi:hypothetical protein
MSKTASVRQVHAGIRMRVEAGHKLTFGQLVASKKDVVFTEPLGLSAEIYSTNAVYPHNNDSITIAQHGMVARGKLSTPIMICGSISCYFAFYGISARQQYNA